MEFDEIKKITGKDSIFTVEDFLKVTEKLGYNCYFSLTEMFEGEKIDYFPDLETPSDLSDGLYSAEKYLCLNVKYYNHYIEENDQTVIIVSFNDDKIIDSYFIDHNNSDVLNFVGYMVSTNLKSMDK